MENECETNASPPRFEKCILHIGTEKTGTTAIQRHLIEQRSKLLKQDLLYPRGANKGFTSQWEFVAVAHPNPWKQDVGRSLGIDSPSDQAKFRTRLLNDLETEFDAAPKARKLLISSEHFQSRLRSYEAIKALKTFLDPWVNDFEIVVYFRRQDRCAISLLSTHLKSSVNLQQSDPIALLNHTTEFLLYDQTYKAWASVFGDAAMRPRIYDALHWHGNDLITDFCELIKIEPPIQRMEEVNTSLKGKGFRFLRALNRRYPATPGDQSDEGRAALVRTVSSIYSGKYYPISRQQAIEFMSQFEDSNENLRQMAFPNLPAPLFGADYSDFPEQAEPLEADYDEAVTVAMDVWRHVYNNKQQRSGFVRRISKHLTKRREN